ncbi:MAG: hypothetical protein ACRDOP_01265 [Gaiellaceae bacterium]
MTRHKSFKRLVRGRMEKTGESYTTARAMLLAAQEPEASEGPPLATSDEAIRERTGRGWEEWFDLLDEWGAAERTHREIARWVAEQQGAEPLAWNVQAVAVGYERARGGRAVGQRADGFAITASKTVAVPVERLFDAFTDEATRDRWLPDGELRERTATRPRSARFDWGDGETRVNGTFLAKGEAKSTVALEHARLPGAEEAEATKGWWRERLNALKSVLEGGEVVA